MVDFSINVCRRRRRNRLEACLKKQVISRIYTNTEYLASNVYCSDVQMDLEKTAATPELHLTSRGLAVAPRPSHTAVLL